MNISIVICTYNRANKILNCLNSVKTSLQQAAPVNAEIVIINNNSSDDTLSVVEGWAKSCPFLVILETETRHGIAWARNKSFEVASGELLVSIDDDCEMDVNHISNMLRHYEKDQKPVLRFGQLELGDIKDWPMTVQTRPFPKQWKQGDPTTDFITMGDICSANMVIPRKIIEDVGLYDPCFGTKKIPGGEDADFGFRVYNAGYMLEYVPDMLAIHFHGRDNSDSVMALVKNYSIAAGALYAKHRLRHPRIVKALSKKRHFESCPSKYANDPRTAQIQSFFKKYKIYNIRGAIAYFIGV